MKDSELKNISSAALAYLGDARHSLFVRRMLVERGITKSGELNAASLTYVTAEAQANMLRRVKPMLLDDELDVFEEEEVEEAPRARRAYAAHHARPQLHGRIVDHALRVLAAAVDDRVDVGVEELRAGDVGRHFADLEIERDERARVLDDLAARDDDRGHLVETAAQQQKLILAGYDPVADLSDHLHRRAQDFKVKKGKGKTNGR